MEIVLATRNQGKIREIKYILRGLGLKFLSLQDFPDVPELKEKGKTFRENAIYKAKEVARLTGKLALADDSGLEVEALSGKPGLFSARFAGKGATDEENNRKLLKLLEGVPVSKRRACFKCSVALAHPSGWVEVREGKCPGLIGLKPKGKSGFGYDPLFIVPRYKLTFAQLSRGIKNEISHRARALKKIRPIINSLKKDRCYRKCREKVS